MAKKPSTQASARATSGSLEIARQKSRRLLKKAGESNDRKTRVADTGVKSEWWASVKNERKLEKKQRQARRK